MIGQSHIIPIHLKKYTFLECCPSFYRMKPWSRLLKGSSAAARLSQVCVVLQPHHYLEVPPVEISRRLTIPSWPQGESDESANCCDKRDIFYLNLQRICYSVWEYYWSITGEEMKCSLKRPCGTNVSHHILFAVLVVSPSSGLHQNHELISTALHARLLQKRIHQACRFLWRVSVLVSSKWELTTSFANLVRSHKLTWIKFFS